MSPQSKALIFRMLTGSRGDDLNRARAAFRASTPEEMDQPYGQSNQTRRQILDGYESADAAIALAITEVLALP